MNLKDLIRVARLRPGLPGRKRLETFRRLPAVSGVRMPRGFDDSSDVSALRALLIPSRGGRLKIPLRVKWDLRPFLREGGMHFMSGDAVVPPKYRIRLHLIQCFNDDGSGGGDDPEKFRNFMPSVVQEINGIYQCCGLQFVYYATSDFEVRKSTLLNQDFDVPANADLTLPQAQKPFTEADIAESSAEHQAERNNVAKQYPGKLVIYFSEGTELRWLDTAQPPGWAITPRTYAFSGGDSEFVGMATAWVSDIKGAANCIAHELGHYFHLAHPFDLFELDGSGKGLREPKTMDEIKSLVKGYIENNGVSYDKGLDVFDYDLPRGVPDTPPDPTGTIYVTLFGDGAECKTDLELPQFQVTFSDNHEESYQLKPDRGNVVSYFKHCTNIEQHLSVGQCAVALEALEKGNRHHLIKVQVGETDFPSLRFNGIWNPSTDNQVVVVGWTRQDFLNKYNELLKDSMRLTHVQGYTLGGQELFDGVWNPGDHGQTIVLGYKPGDFQGRYHELWNQGMRLERQQTYVLGAERLYNGIWNEEEHGQVVVWGYRREDLEAKYAELWQQDMRLIQQQAYFMDGGLRYDAIWNPGSHGQVVVWEWKPEDYVARYAELWEQNMRLIQQQSFVWSGQLLHNGIWDPQAGAQYVSWGKTREYILSEYDEMWQQGMRLICLDNYPV